MNALKLAAAAMAGAAVCALTSPTALAADRSAADRSAADRSAADRSTADRSAAGWGAATRPWPSPGSGSWLSPADPLGGWFPWPPATASRPVPVGPPGRWDLKFADEFNGTSVDTTKWSFRSDAEADWSSTPFGTGNPDNQQLEFDQPANCTVSGGVLDITAKPDDITSSAGKHYRWSSCMINTSPSYAFRYGYTEVRAKLPAPKGFWSALWTWAAPGVTLPAHGETDAFEFYSDNRSRLYLTEHSSSAALQNNPSGIGLPGPNAGGTVHRPPFDPTADFHVYGVDIQPWGTDWWIDGRLVYHSSRASHGPVNILLDNFVYSKIPPEPGSQGHLLVDYVRAWQRPGPFTAR